MKKISIITILYTLLCSHVSAYQVKINIHPSIGPGICSVQESMGQFRDPLITKWSRDTESPIFESDEVNSIKFSVFLMQGINGSVKRLEIEVPQGIDDVDAPFEVTIIKYQNQLFYIHGDQRHLIIPENN